MVSWLPLKFNFGRFLKLSSAGLGKVAAMLFFLAVFDGILSYLAPLIMVGRGLSPALMGIILGSSSVAGALFDFLLSRWIDRVNARRLYLVTLVLCLVFSLLLWQGKTALVFLLAMAVWGLYYDLLGFANFGFVSRFTFHRAHAASFGILDVFRSFGYFLASLLASFLVVRGVDHQPFLFAWGFWLLAVFFGLRLDFGGKARREKTFTRSGFFRGGFKTEWRLWRLVSRQILPVLLFTLMINVFDSFFWTVGPLFAESLARDQTIGALLLPAYALPPLIAGWFVGKVTDRLGKKNTAFGAFLWGALLLLLIGWCSSPVLVVGIVFLASLGSSLAWPAIYGVYADYISETMKVEKEIEALADFFANLGYVFGPILAGGLAGLLGNNFAFSLLGIFCIVCTLGIRYFTPREIKVKTPTTASLKE